MILYYFEVARCPIWECFSYKHEVLKHATRFSLTYRDNSCRFISKIQLTTTLITVVVTVELGVIVATQCNNTTTRYIVKSANWECLAFDRSTGRSSIHAGAVVFEENRISKAIGMSAKRKARASASSTEFLIPSYSRQYCDRNFTT